MTAYSAPSLPALLGIRDLRTEPGRASAAMTVAAQHLRPGGELVHAASVIALADTLAGSGCMASLPEGATGFATSTITTHHLSSAPIGDELLAEATMLHGGRSTQVWDVTVRRGSDGRVVATLRNVQQLLYPR